MATSKAILTTFIVGAIIIFGSLKAVDDFLISGGEYKSIFKPEVVENKVYLISFFNDFKNTEDYKNLSNERKLKTEELIESIKKYIESNMKE